MHSRYDYKLPLAPKSWAEQSDISRFNWENISVLEPFKVHDNSKLAKYATMTRVCCDLKALYIRYDCVDFDIWGTYTERDEPIYDEEVVEVFIGHGEADLINYFEFEISPNGVLFDATIYNPTSLRADLTFDPKWNCDGVQWYAERHDAENRWVAVLVIPWASLSQSQHKIPNVWRANFYRIERPRDSEPEFSCWSPTMAEPADFHKPTYYGTLRLPNFDDGV